MTDQVDYDSLAKAHGGSPDYDAIAREHGGSSAQKSTAELYPTFSKIPGFEMVRPAFDLAAGAGAGVAETATGLYDLVRKIPGASRLLPDSAPAKQAIVQATPDTTSAGVGKFAEHTMEFMVPAGKAATATKGAGLLTRAAAQAGVGAGVSAVQSGGDPASMATGAALGAGGEFAGAAAGGVKSLLAKKAPTLANFSESFGNATPTQKARISKALDLLERDGIVPADSVHETQDVIKGKLDELGQAYQNLDPAIRARQQPVQYTVRQLQNAQQQFMRRGVITDKAGFDAIQGQIETLEGIAAKNGGNVDLEDLLHMKQTANGKTNFQSPDADKSLWKAIGNAYRGAADVLAPETTPLNRDYQKYKDLEQIIDQNIARGKGTTPSGLSALLTKATQHGTGAAAGAAVGGAVAGPVGAAAGSVAGGFFGPKVGKAAAQALQNAVDSGAFKSLAPAKQAAIRSMAAIGDNAGILKLLGVSATEEAAGR